MDSRQLALIKIKDLATQYNLTEKEIRSALQSHVKEDIDYSRLNRILIYLGGIFILAG